MSTIKFSVHRNPKSNPDAPDTYHVRQDSYHTANRAEIVSHLQNHHHLSSVYTEPLLTELPRVIMEYLTNNQNVHLQGLGTFSLRLGLRQYQEDEGNTKTVYTNPAKITGNDVLVEGITFRPDKEFLNLLQEHPIHIENATGRGHVGHTAQYSEEQVRRQVSNYLAEHDFITRRQLMHLMNLTEHTARKWLEQLTTAPNALLKGEKVGTLFIYHLC